MVRLKTKIGNSQLEIEGSDFKAICKASSLIGMIPDKCGKCGMSAIYLYHKSPKGNDYYGVQCKSCGAEFNFHQRKEGGFYIKHDDEWTKFGEDEQPKSGEKFEDDIPDDIF